MPLLGELQRQYQKNGPNYSALAGARSEVKRLRRERIVRASMPSMILGLLAYTLCVYLMYASIESDYKSCWLFAGWGAIIFRFVVWFYCVKPGSGKQNISDGEFALITLSICMVGLVWGALALFWKPDQPTYAQLQIFLFPVAVAAGALMSFGAVYRVFLSFMIPCISPLLVVLLLSDAEGTNATGLLALFYMVALATMGRLYEGQLLQGICLQLDKQALVDDLSQQNISLMESKEQVEAASNAKSEFLARMSHEIRTPMNGVLGMTQVLQSTRLSKRQAQLSDTIYTSAESLLDLLDDLLDSSSLESKKLKLEQVGFELPALIDQVTRMFAEAATVAGLELTSQINDDVPRFVIGDPFRIRQILTNLVGNAIKFSKEGRVAIDVALVESTEQHHEIALSVKDNGMGIDSKNLDMIFESFSQVDGSTSRRFGGAGLGLAISRDLVHLMDGSISVSSEVDVGSEFVCNIKLGRAEEQDDLQIVDLSQPGKTVVRPRSAVTKTEVEAESRIADSFPGARVLVVEDCPINQEVAIAMLEGFGCNVNVADQGQAAINVIGVYQFDIVFMDCQMPVVDGYQATRTIREKEKKGRIPIVALTANALPGDREKCLAAGMDDYLTKPVQEEDLRKALSRWTTKGKHVTPRRNLTQQPTDYATPKHRNSIESTEVPGPTIDLETLKQLQKLDKGKGLVCRVIDAFRDSTPRLMDDLREAVAEASVDKIKIASHSMKSSSANLGALPFSSLCREIEEKARANNIDNVAEDLEKLELLFVHMLLEFDKVYQASVLKKSA